MVFLCSICGDENIIHIDKYISICQLVPENGVHHALKCSRCISHSKVHYFGLKEPFVSLEGGFVLILWSDKDIIVPLVYIHFCEVFLSC